MERPDPLDLNTLDGRLWDVWSRYPAAPLPDDLDPRARDFNAFAAGVKATVLAFIGDEGWTLGDTLVASLVLRDTMTRHADPGRDAGPGDSPEPA
jgi:hypothetical protein